MSDIPRNREEYILAALRLVEGGSRAHRQRAIDILNRQGIADEEISAALHAETTRLENIRDTLHNMPGFRNYRALAAEAINKGDALEVVPETLHPCCKHPWCRSTTHHPDCPMATR